MWKKLLAIGLILGIMFSELTQMPETVQAASNQDAYASIEKQVKDFASSIYYAGADKDAALVLAKHGVTNRSTLKVGKNHALTVTLYNAKLMQQTVTEVLSILLSYPQEELTQLYYGGGVNWDTYYWTLDAYNTSSYNKEDASRIYYTYYTGDQNSYDHSLEWMAGHVSMKYVVKPTGVTKDTRSFSVQLIASDRFDFRGNNGSVSQDVASLLGSFLFREFEWQSTVSFNITVPNVCGHSPEKYHYIYDTNAQKLTCDTTNGFKENNGIGTYTSASGRDGYFYRLKETIQLNHDAPWTMEIAVKNPAQMVWQLNSNCPRLVLSGKSRLVFYVPERDSSSQVVRTRFYGTKLNGNFSFNTQDIYRFSLQNEVAKDGSNMIYLTVYNQTTDKEVMSHVPMDDEFVVGENGSWSVIDEQNNGMNGIDLQVWYLGNASNPIQASYYEVTFWEQGADTTQADYLTHKVTKPTCTAKGYTTHTCPHCGYSYKDTYVNATGHKFGAWTHTQNLTCTQDGIEQRTCTTCKTVETRTETASGHKYTAEVTGSTCTKGGYTTYTCSCGDTYVDQHTEAAGHQMGSWTTIQELTCLKNGIEKRECSKCTYSETRTEAAQGHVYNLVVTEATCTQDGYTTHTCSCGDTYVDSKVKAPGHTWDEGVVLVEPTEETKGQKELTCLECGEKVLKNIPELNHEHAYEEVVTDPTCTEGGYTTHLCECEDSYITDETEALGHDYQEWYTSVESTCTSLGEERRDCSRCEEYELRTTDITDHCYGEWTVAVEATEDQPGTEERFCTCGERETREYTLEEKAEEPEKTRKRVLIYVVCGCAAVVGIIRRRKKLQQDETATNRRGVKDEKNIRK